MSATIGIATPCYRHGKFLPEMLDSVIAQTFTDWICTIVIDGPDPLAESVAFRYANRDARIHVIALEQSVGLPRARNMAIRATQTPWILPFDADDWMEPPFVATLFEAATSSPRMTGKHPIAFTPARLVFPDGRDEVFYYPPYNAKRIADEVMMPGCALMPRALYEELQGYDEAWDCGATDWMFYVRGAAKNILWPVKAYPALWNYRQHEGFRNHHRGEKMLPLLKIEMKKALAGKRAYGEPLPFKVAQ